MMSFFPRINHGKSILLSVVSFFFELFLFLKFLDHSISFIFFLALHCLMSLIILLLVYDSYRKEKDLCYPMLLFLAAFVTGPLGILGFILFAVLKPIFSLFSIPSSVWFEGLFPERELSSFAKIFERIQFGWDDYGKISEVSSFQDLFTHGTLFQKQAVLDAIVKDFDPTYCPILKEALEDPQNAVRIQAAAIVSKIDIDFEKELMDLLEKKEKDPQDELIDGMLASHYDAYFSLGILGIIREKEMGGKAIEFYQKHLKIHPLDRKSFFSVLRILFRIKNFSSFISWSDEYREKFKSFPTIAHFWYLEALYRLGRYEELSEAFRRVV